MQIALDAMGGDHAPGPIVAGAVQAVAADPEMRITLVGDRTQVEPLLADAGVARERMDIFHCTQAVTMEETPVEALRKKPDNSISRCWQLLAERKVDAVVSAGALESCSDPAVVLTELARVLKPSGILIASTPREDR